MRGRFRHIFIPVKILMVLAGIPLAVFTFLCIGSVIWREGGGLGIVFSFFGIIVTFFCLAFAFTYPPRVIVDNAQRQVSAKNFTTLVIPYDKITVVMIQHPIMWLTWEKIYLRTNDNRWLTISKVFYRNYESLKAELFAGLPASVSITSSRDSR